MIKCLAYFIFLFNNIFELKIIIFCLQSNIKKNKVINKEALKFSRKNKERH